MHLDIVIVTYRSAAHLEACLTALPAEARVVVVDNASPDQGPDIAEAAGAQVIRNRLNCGFGAAANQGAAVGSAEFILFLNPDAVVEGSDLELLINALETDQRMAVVGPRLAYPDGREQPAWWPFPSPLGTMSSSRAPGFVIGACMLVRRSAFESVGGFDPRFWLYGEETDLCYRLWEAGWRVRLVPEAVATHVGGASGVSTLSMTFEHRQRGPEHFIAKHYGSRALAIYRLRMLSGSVMRVPVLALRRDRKAAAYRWAVARRLARRLVTQPFTVAPPSG